MSNAAPLSNPPRVERSTGRLLIQFLGSMSLAVTLLVALAIASVIGTILKQNQPYQDYIIKFGAYWFEVFKALNLFDVYHSWWFLGILSFLVVSTSTCLIRQTPGMLREMRELRVRMHEKALLAFKAQRVLHSGLPVAETAARAAQVLQEAGYKTREETEEGGIARVAGHKGALNRVGYILTHLAIIIICIGGLMDGNLPIQLDILRGELQPEKDFSKPVSQIPAKSWLNPSNPSFRGNVSIPEGDSSGVIFLQVGDGYLVQDLGFRVYVKRFHIEHYSTGMPKTFASDVVIYDQNKPVKEATITVNHPLIYKGVAIYQASFSDGGSLLRMQGHFLNSPDGQPVPMQGRVGEVLKSRDGQYQIELKNFSMFNIVPADEASAQAKGRERKMMNLGPSFDYIVRDATGKGREFQTYMVPFMREGHSYFVQGVRLELDQPFRYLFLPVGPDGSLDLFTRYFAEVRKRAAANSNLAPENLFVSSFQDVVKAGAPGMSQEDQAWFFQAAIEAMLQLREYPTPFILSLDSFEQRQATGLQMTRSPGKNVVYFGSVMLVIGIFILFYLPHRKVWVRVRRTEDGGTEALVAGTSNRNTLDFEKAFASLTERMAGRLERSS